MLSIASASLGAVFFFSEAGLALWRRATLKVLGTDHDSGSLRMLWIVTFSSIWIGVLFAVKGAKPPLSPALLWDWLGALVFALGMALRWWSIWHLGRFFTVNVAVADDHRLIDTGPYRFIRHPSYTGLILQLTGLAFTLGTLPSLLVVLIPPTLAILRRIQIEEAVLRTHFGGVYAGYEARTKKMVPLIF